MKVITAKPIAFDSYDHIAPYGTKDDSTKSAVFNTALYEVFGQLTAKQLRLLDLGCAGGGLVETFHLDKGLAIGIEGSDYSLVRKRDAWGRIPEYLFTADITEPFQVLGNDDKLFQFHIITMWETLEHLKTEALSQVFQNVKDHLCHEPLSLFLGTVSTVPCGAYHQTVQNEAWWNAKFREHGFERDTKLEAHFKNRWLRTEPDGNGTSFGFVARMI